MSREDVIAVATRLFVIYLLFGIISEFPSALGHLEQGAAPTTPYVLVLVVALGTCALLWMFPLSVARRLLPSMREPRSEQSIDSRLAMSLGIALIGLWFLAGAILDSIYWLVFALQMKKLGMGSQHLTHDQWASIAATAAQFVLALVLLLGANGIRNAIEYLRHGGRRHYDGADS